MLLNHHTDFTVIQDIVDGNIWIWSNRTIGAEDIAILTICPLIERGSTHCTVPTITEIIHIRIHINCLSIIILITRRVLIIAIDISRIGA